MAVIKDFFTEKNKRNKDNLDYREKIRAHKLSVFIRTVVGLALFIGLLAVSNYAWRDKSLSVSSVVSTVPVSVVTGANTMNLNGSLLIYSKDGASCIDSKGKAVWNESYEMQAPLVSVCGSTVAIGDYNGRTIYVANKDKTLGTIKTNLPIRAVTVSDNGVVATVLDDSDVIRIYVYDGNLDTDTPIVEAKATMNKSGYPISVSLSPNGKIMMVSYFYVDSGNMKSSVSFYNFGEVGSNEIDNFVSGYDYAGALLPYVQYMDNDSAFGVANDRLVFFRGDEIPENRSTALLSESVIGVYHSSSYVGLVYMNPSSENAYRMDVYDDNGNNLSKIEFDIDYTDIVINKDQIIIYGGNDCEIFTVKGIRKYQGTFDKDVNLLIPTSSTYKYLLVTSDSMDMVELN